MLLVLLLQFNLIQLNLKVLIIFHNELRQFAHFSTAGDIHEFLWFEHPEGDPFDPPFWQANVLGQDICDTYQVLATLDTTDGPLEALFTSTYLYTLSLRWILYNAYCDLIFQTPLNQFSKKHI